MLRRLERTWTGYETMPTIGRLCNAYGLGIDYLFGREV